MKAIDTNVLLRYLTQDDAAQAARAEAFIRQYATAIHPVFINRIVLCELVWVLARFYRYERPLIATVVEKLLSTEEFLVEDSGAAWLALEEYRKTKADFADALIGKINQAAGYAKTGTFDKDAAKLAAFEEI